MDLLNIGNSFRFMRKNRTFNLINMAGLAFGFTCAILIIYMSPRKVRITVQSGITIGCSTCCRKVRIHHWEVRLSVMHFLPCWPGKFRK